MIRNVPACCLRLSFMARHDAVSIERKISPQLKLLMACHEKGPFQALKSRTKEWVVKKNKVKGKTYTRARAHTHTLTQE